MRYYDSHPFASRAPQKERNMYSIQHGNTAQTRNATSIVLVNGDGNEVIVTIAANEQVEISVQTWADCDDELALVVDGVPMDFWPIGERSAVRVYKSIDDGEVQTVELPHEHPVAQYFAADQSATSITARVEDGTLVTYIKLEA